jgi:hypothetical protein
MIYAILLLFAAGFLVKLSDMFSDGKAGKKNLTHYASHVSGILYGIISGYVIVTYPVLAPLGVAVMLSVLFTKKIDHPVHFLGIGSSVIVFSFLGLPKVELIPLVFFLCGGAADEIGNGLADNKKIKGLAGRFFGWRLTLETFALVFSAVTGIWPVFFSILSFDAGYILADRIHRTRL